MKSRLTLAILAITLLAGSGCENPFAPKKHTPGGEVRPPAPSATTPTILLDNLNRAMNDRDKELYETLLDQNFWFTEPNCLGELVFANGREEELEIMGGSRDGSNPGIFSVFRTFEFEFSLIAHTIELGPEYPKAYEGDPDGHPDEDWEVFRGRVQMLLLQNEGDGFRVDQVMTYKMRRAEDGLWKIIRWETDPLAGECNTATKPVAGLTSWAALKQRLR